MDLCFVHGNDCSIQIAVSLCGNIEEFVRLMNQKAEELNLKNTHFVSPHGLDDEEHYTTAYELALISDYALNINKISEVVNTKTYIVNINGYPKKISNTNELLGYLYGVNGIKTGFTNKAGRCLVTSVERNGFNIIIVVLGAYTKKIRTIDTIQLIEYIYSNYELIDLEELINQEYIDWYNINKKRIQVYKAKNSYINIILEDNNLKMYPIKKENKKDIIINITNENMFLEAPIYKDTIIAVLKVSIGNEEISNLKIYIKDNIERKNWRNYFKECLNNFL